MIDVKLRRSVLLSVVGKYSHYAMQLLSLMVLARVFSITEFGIVAVLTVLATFFMLIGEFGIGPALINKNIINPRLRDSAFFFSAVLGVIIFIFFSSIGPLIADFYKQPAYSNLVFLTSASVLFFSASTVPLVSLQKDIKFIQIGLCEVLAELITLIIVLVLWFFFQHMSLVILTSKPLIYSFLRFFFLYFCSRKTQTGAVKPRLIFDKSEMRGIYRFSKYQFSANLAVYISRNLDNLLIGRYFSSDILAVYEKSYQIMRYPLQLLSFALTPAIQPVLSAAKLDRDSFNGAYVDFTNKLALLASAIALGFFYFSDFIVLVLLGDKWLEVAFYLKVFAISLPVQIVLSSTGAFYQAADKPELLFKCTLFSLITNVSAIIFGIFSKDIEILCLSLCASFYVNYLQCNYILLSKVLDEVSIKTVTPIIIVSASSIFILIAYVFL